MKGLHLHVCLYLQWDQNWGPMDWGGTLRPAHRWLNYQQGPRTPSGLSVVCLRHGLRHCLATDPWRHRFLWHHHHVTSSGRDVIDRSMTPHISCSYSSFADAISSAVVGQIFCPNIFYYLIFLLLSSPDLIGRVMEWWAGGRMSKTLCTYQWN